MANTVRIMERRFKGSVEKNVRLGEEGNLGKRVKSLEKGEWSDSSKDFLGG